MWEMLQHLWWHALPPRLRLTTSSTKPKIHSKGRIHNPTTRGWTESPEAATAPPPPPHDALEMFEMIPRQQQQECGIPWYQSRVHKGKRLLDFSGMDFHICISRSHDEGHGLKAAATGFKNGIQCGLDTLGDSICMCKLTWCIHSPQAFMCMQSCPVLCVGYLLIRSHHVCQLLRSGNTEFKSPDDHIPIILTSVCCECTRRMNIGRLE